jgi:hypothetical protein
VEALMHTSTIRALVDESPCHIRIHHNGDWSGEAIIIWEFDKCGHSREIRLPGAILKAFVRHNVEVAIEEIEQALTTLGKMR